MPSVIKSIILDSGHLGLASASSVVLLVDKSGLLDEAHATGNHNESLGTEDDNEGDESANDTGNGARDARVRGGGSGVDGRVAVAGGALGSRVAASVAPASSVGDGKLAHAGLEVIPREGGLGLAKERVLGELVLGGSAVGEEEADRHVLLLGVGGGGNKLKGHGGGVVADAEELGVSLLQLSKTEEGHEGTVGAKLGVEGGGALLLVGKVSQGVEGLAGENSTSNGADGLGLGVGKVPFVGRGEGVEAVEVLGVVDEVLAGVGLVVNLGDIEVVKDWRQERVSYHGALTEAA